MMRTALIIIGIFLSAASRVLADGKPVMLHYKFIDAPPHFQVAGSGNIYVVAEDAIFKFDKQGNLLKKILPFGQKREFTSFTVSAHEKTIYLLAGASIYAKVYGYDQSTGKISYSVKFSGGSNLKIDRDGLLYVSYQDGTDVTMPAVNKLRVFEQSGKNYNYPSTDDLGADNFEIIGSKIALYTPGDGSCYLLPVIHTPGLKEVKTKLNLPTGEKVIVIGSIADQYYFQYYDRGSRTDIIVAYDARLKLYKKFVLPFNNKDIVLKDEDFLIDNPSGSVYSYDGGNHIYFLRNTRKGAFINDLSDFVK